MFSIVVRVVTVLFIFFFFQAEDGIRDLIVTGVQTCALPICEVTSEIVDALVERGIFRMLLPKSLGGAELDPLRSEEHTSELQSRSDIVCRLLLEKKIISILTFFTLSRYLSPVYTRFMLLPLL